MIENVAWALYHSSILSVPQMAKGVLVPSPLKANKIKDDREFEWLLCLASIFQASQRLQPTEVGEAQRPSPAPDLPHQAAKAPPALQ